MEVSISEQNKVLSALLYCGQVSYKQSPNTEWYWSREGDAEQAGYIYASKLAWASKANSIAKVPALFFPVQALFHLHSYVKPFCYCKELRIGIALGFFSLSDTVTYELLF